MIKRVVIFCLMVLSCSTASAQLFSLDARRTAGSKRVALDFLERYFVDLLTQRETTIEQKMRDDKVYFRKGSIKDLRQINDTVPFSITLLDRYYEARWMHGSEPFLTIVFPAQYDLLLGMNQEEAQKQLKDVIMSAPAAPPITRRTEAKADTFLIATLTDTTYYDNVGIPVFDAKHPEYAAANLFAGLIADADYRMYVEQSVYGLKTVSYTITLRQWLNYCAEWGLKTYFAIEEQREDGLLALVIVHSKELCFNHTLSVVLPLKFVSDKNAVLKVRMTPYIPTHNLKNLYQQEPKNRKKIKWQ